MWRCVFETATGKGVAFNRPAVAGEFVVEIEPRLCGDFANTPGRYQHVDGSFGERPGWTAEQAYGAVVAAVEAKIAAIEAHKAVLQIGPFLYQGHLYYTDGNAMSDFERTKARCQRLAGTDPIPTPPPIAGHWLSADVDPETGLRVPVAFTVEQFYDLSDALYDNRALLWAAEVMHKLSVQTMAATGATAEQIAAYDHTANW
jgi:hypothetical protein